MSRFAPHAYVRTWVLQLRVAALQTIEVIRHNAAVNKGQLPGSLKDLPEDLVPLDPITGAPFDYRLQGDTAELSAASIDLMGIEDTGIAYRLRMAPPKKDSP